MHCAIGCARDSINRRYSNMNRIPTIASVVVQRMETPSVHGSSTHLVPVNDDLVAIQGIGDHTALLNTSHKTDRLFRN